MRHQSSGSSGRSIAGRALAVWVAAGGTAVAEENVDYCIRCAAPDETYVCRVHAVESGAQGQQFFCVMSIAQQFQHESCAVSNQPEACVGQLVQLEAPVPGSVPGGVPERNEAAPAAPSEAPPVPANGTSQKPPKTLVEFSKQTVAATGKGIKTAGETAGHAIQNTGEMIGDFAGNVGRSIKDATGKALHCVGSLFTKCGE